METMKLGKYVLCKMEAQEYDKMYDADMQEAHNGVLDSIVWLEKYEADELVATSMDNMLVFKDGTFAYTSRGIIFKASLAECLAVTSWMEEL